MEVLESFERMNLVVKYRKWRPEVPRKGHIKEWYVFKCTTCASLRCYTWMLGTVTLSSLTVKYFSSLAIFFFRWHFAYNCILEERVRRRRQMWSWQFISQHRKICKMYKNAYKKKLSSKKVIADVEKTLEVNFYLSKYLILKLKMT